MISRLVFLPILLGLLGACNPPKSISQSPKASTAAIIPGPPALIYKTRGDYYDKVPVLLTEDKKHILSYPHPTDLKTGGAFAYPTALSKGYLLDNRGINKHVAFLKLSYTEYAALRQKPDTATLMQLILDADPLTELFFCGSRKQYEEDRIAEQLNEVIENGQTAERFERIK